VARFDGLPLHPLLVHAPVVLIPVVALGLVLVLARPALRRQLAPLVAVLAVVAAATATAAVWTGGELAEALGRGAELDHHRAWGRWSRTAAITVAVGAIAFAVVDRWHHRRANVAAMLGVVTSGLALATVAIVAIAGHSGATLAWQDRLPEAGDGVAAGAPSGPAESVTGVDPKAEQPDPDDRSEAGGMAPAAGSPGVDLVLGEWAIITSATEVPPGTTAFRFHNRGTVPHAVRIRSAGSGPRLEWRTERIEPGGWGVLVADLPPGTYDVDCPIEDAAGEHDALGMELRLEVREGAAALLPLPAGGTSPGDTNDGTEPGSGTTQEPGTVSIEGFAFAPEVLRIPVGAEVVWSNRDPAPHTATGASFDTGRLAQGDAGSVTFPAAGSFDYRCTLHPAMRGTVVVAP
jgi:plastocyanin/uncharacterized membrane protein